MKTLRQVRILLHIVSEHTSEENNFIQVFATKMKGQQDLSCQYRFCQRMIELFAARGDLPPEQPRLPGWL